MLSAAPHPPPPKLTGAPTPDIPHPPPPTASSQAGGPGALPGLPPLGVNGFGPLTPQTNGQPGTDSLYNNGLSPYPGGPSCPTQVPTPVPMVEWGAEGSYGYGGDRAQHPGNRDLSLLQHLFASPPSPPSPCTSLPSFTAGLATFSPAQSPGVADPLQQAYAGMQHFAGFLRAPRPGGVGVGLKGPRKD